MQQQQSALSQEIGNLVKIYIYKHINTRSRLERILQNAFHSLAVQILSFDSSLAKGYIHRLR